jgi:hypothetical protein
MTTCLTLSMIVWILREAEYAVQHAKRRSGSRTEGVGMPTPCPKVAHPEQVMKSLEARHP